MLKSNTNGIYKKFLNKNAFDISLLNDNYIPSLQERSLLYSFHRLLSSTEYRLKRSKVLNEGGLSRWDFKLNNIYFNYDTGYFRLNKDLKTLNRQIYKFTQKSNEMVDKFENMESNVIRKECIKWIVEWPSPFTQSMISNDFPNLLESPCYEIGSCSWQCQLRKIQITKHKNNNQYKLGVFIRPKQIQQFNHLISLKAKIKLIITIKYKEIVSDQYLRYSQNQITFNKDDNGNIIEKIEIEHENEENDDNEDKNNKNEEQILQIKTKDISFDINTDFIKLQGEETRIMSWGKFIPELQDVIDTKTGLIPHENICIDIQFQIIDQCMTYKQRQREMQS